MHLQTDLEFKQNQIKKLNDEFDVKIFMSFDNIRLLVNDLLEQFVRKENNEKCVGERHLLQNKKLDSLKRYY